LGKSPFAERAATQAAPLKGAEIQNCITWHLSVLGAPQSSALKEPIFFSLALTEGGFKALA
jgi:hypothetical protein